MATNKIINDLAIEDSIKEFSKQSEGNDNRELTFDFCYNYFRTMREKAQDDDNMEMSCYVLWSYLASWGMLRNSYLLQKNPSFLKPLIELICTEDYQALFHVDVDKYGDDKIIKKLISCYNEIRKTISEKEKEGRKASITLVTKIMLGVFACVPAYDSYFTETFRGLVSDPKSKIEGNAGDFPNYKNELKPSSLKSIFIFYQNNKDVIDEQRSIYVRNFDGKNTKFRYSIAKIIDMFGFMYGSLNYSVE